MVLLSKCAPIIHKGLTLASIRSFHHRRSIEWFYQLELGSAQPEGFVDLITYGWGFQNEGKGWKLGQGLVLRRLELGLCMGDGRGICRSLDLKAL